MKLVSAKEMQRIDRYAISVLGVPRRKLMENAGRAVVETLQRIYARKLTRKRVLIVAGKGNNAGDGFVAARLLHRLGSAVSICLMTHPKHFKDETRENFGRLQKRRIPAFYYQRSLFQKKLKSADLVIDALFGTGLHSPVRGTYKSVISDINSSRRDVIAVDIPSGLCGNSGQVLGAAVKAKHTITFGLPKTGLVLPPGSDCAGTVHIRNIGFPKKLLKSSRSDMHYIEPSDFSERLPHREKSAHKGVGGHLLLIAGSPGKTGAAIMAAQAAFRTGSGLITLLTHEGAIGRISPRMKESFLDIFPKNERQLKVFLKDKNAVAIGPGMGFSDQAKGVLRGVIQKSRKPTVIDADALTLLSKHLSWLRESNAPIILTPHPGEMARLLHTTSKAVQRDRLGIARRFAKKHRLFLVLKGAGTIVATPQGRLFINATGNPALATAGTGDVLTGMIASLIAQSMPVEAALQAAVYLHGLLADQWRQKMRASRGLLATDLIRAIPRILEQLLSPTVGPN